MSVVLPCGHFLRKPRTPTYNSYKGSFNHEFEKKSAVVKCTRRGQSRIYQPRYCGVLLYNILGLYPPEA